MLNIFALDLAAANNGSGGLRKIDLGDEGRLKYGPVKRKAKASRPSFDQVKGFNLALGRQ